MKGLVKAEIHGRSKQSGWLGLAQPLFHRLNMHVCNLNTREVVGLGIRTGNPSHEQPGYEAKPSQKTTAHHCANSTDKKGNIALGFSALLVSSLAIPYFDKARAA